MNEGKFYPDSQYLSALQAAAEADGRNCVIGGLIKNEAGQIFVQKRAMDRSLFPGCWDIAGGHVEPGETLFGALAREVREETGWQVVEILGLVKILDWEEERNGRIIRNREFDFIIRVDGDLNAPRLELNKITEFRWMSLADLDILLQNRTPPDLFIYDIVKTGLEMD